MVDNRSAGMISGIAGGINFRSGDISGTAAKTSDDRASQGTEYFMQEGEEPVSSSSDYVDRSTELRASLNSLALLNVVSILRNNRNKAIIFDDEDFTERIKPYKVNKVNNKNNDEGSKKEN